MASNEQSGVTKRVSFSTNFKSSRLSLGAEVGLDTDDIIAVMGNADFDSSDLSFCCHQSKGKYGVFTINNAGTDDVKHVGTAQSSVNGMDYMLAFVNKKTGLSGEFRPVSLVQFQAKYRPAELNMTVINQENDKLKAEIDMEEVASRRRNLTAEFGSIKKNKFLDSSFRRSVDEKTLTAITPAVFNAAVASASGTAEAIVATYEGLEGDYRTSSNAPKNESITPLSQISLLKNSLLKKRAPKRGKKV